MPVEQSTAATRTAADVMTPSPRTCSPYSSVLEAVLIFRDADCGAVPVIDNGKPIGVVTDRDVALALADYPDLPSHPVSDIMSKAIVAVGPETSLAQVQEKFANEAVRRLLVTSGEQLVGIIGWADIASHIPDHAVGRVVTDVVTKP
jgi:CBS domain-containing protein